MEKLLSLRQQNPFNITVYAASALAINKVEEKKCSNNTMNQGANNQEKEKPRNKTDGKEGNKADGKAAFLHL